MPQTHNIQHPANRPSWKRSKPSTASYEMSEEPPLHLSESLIVRRISGHPRASLDTKGRRHPMPSSTSCRITRYFPLHLMGYLVLLEHVPSSQNMSHHPRAYPIIPEHAPSSNSISYPRVCLIIPQHVPSSHSLSHHPTTYPIIPHRVPSSQTIPAGSRSALGGST